MRLMEHVDRRIVLDPDRLEAIVRAIPTWNFSAHDFSDDELLHAASLMLQHALSMQELEQWRIPAGALTSAAAALTAMSLRLHLADWPQTTCTVSCLQLEWRTMISFHTITFDMSSMYYKPCFTFSSNSGPCPAILQTRPTPLDRQLPSPPWFDRLMP